MQQATWDNGVEIEKFAVPRNFTRRDGEGVESGDRSACPRSSCLFGAIRNCVRRMFNSLVLLQEKFEDGPSTYDDRSQDLTRIRS